MGDPGTTTDPETRGRRADGGDDWPIREDVLRSLSEDVRPARANKRRRPHADAVAAAVRECLAERVRPTAGRDDRGQLRPRLRRRRRSAGRRPPDPRDEATVLAAARTQTRLMAVPSRYPADGKYYAANAPHASRTVEELRLCRWTTASAAADDGPGLVYTAGTVLHCRDTGACHLRGFTDPRCLVPVDCARLTAVLPRHLSTVKMYAELRARPDDGPVLVPHHFQVFHASVPFG